MKAGLPDVLAQRWRSDADRLAVRRSAAVPTGLRLSFACPPSPRAAATPPRTRRARRAIPRIQPITTPTSSTDGMKMKCPAVIVGCARGAVRRSSARISSSTLSSRRQIVQTIDHQRDPDERVRGDEQRRRRQLIGAAAASSTGTNSLWPGGRLQRRPAQRAARTSQRDQRREVIISPHPRDTARRAPPGARRGSTRSVSSTTNSSMNAATQNQNAHAPSPRGSVGTTLVCG